MLRVGGRARDILGPSGDEEGAVGPAADGDRTPTGLPQSLEDQPRPGAWGHWAPPIPDLEAAWKPSHEPLC